MIRRDYYIIKGGLPLEKFDQVSEQIKEFDEKSLALKEKFGAINTATLGHPFDPMRGYILSGFVFSEILPKNWKKIEVSGLNKDEVAGSPKRNSKAGKEIIKEMEAASINPNIKARELYDLFGESRVYSDGRLARASGGKVGGAKVVVIPKLADAPPIEVDGAVRIEEWEYLKMQKEKEN